MLHDAVVMGSGPNGLTAACVLAKRGLNVHVVEAAAQLGGGTRTAELTLPGFRHDVCSAVHTMGCLSPAFEELQLEQHGLEWIYPKFSAAHPLDGDRVALLQQSVDETASAMGADAATYRRLLSPFGSAPREFFRDALSPLLRWPSAPALTTRFRLLGLASAERFARRFETDEARALFAGCAAHSILSFDRWLTGGVGLMFLITGHAKSWPIARGGSTGIAQALGRVLQQSGGTIELNHEVTQLSALPPARSYLFDLAPAQVARIAQGDLPSSYGRKLERFRMGSGVFKLDWALDGPIPWRSKACFEASTVHVGGTFEEIAAAEAQVAAGQHSDNPFLIVCQQSLLDPSRAPEDRHTGYAYCHVPADSDVDMTSAIEAQVERFAPGFRDRILARHTFSPAAFQAYNPSYIGGAITGGSMDLQQIIARPTLRFDPYSTPNPKLFLCSQSTPPGGGVHGMSGYYAARSVLRRLGVKPG